MELFKLYKQWGYILTGVGVSLLLFDISWYAMSTFPASINDMCVPGGNLTFENIAYSGVMSFLLGLLCIGMYEVFRLGGAFSTMGVSTSVGGIMTFFSVFCTICTLPVLSLFGISLSLNFVTEYNTWFKLLTFGIVLWTYAAMNKKVRLQGACAR